MARDGMDGGVFESYWLYRNFAAAAPPRLRAVAAAEEHAAPAQPAPGASAPDQTPTSSISPNSVISSAPPSATAR